MADAPRRFDMHDPEPAVDALQFVLGGMTRADSEHPSEPWEETFTVLDHLPPASVPVLASSATVNDQGEVVWSMMAVVRFLRAVIVPEDEAKFDALMADKRRPCPLQALADVMFYITGTKADRPTGPQPGSPAGSAATDTGSTNGSNGKAAKASKRSAHRRS